VPIHSRQGKRFYPVVSDGIQVTHFFKRAGAGAGLVDVPECATFGGLIESSKTQSSETPVVSSSVPLHHQRGDNIMTRWMGIKIASVTATSVVSGMLLSGCLGAKKPVPSEEPGVIQEPSGAQVPTAHGLVEGQQPVTTDASDQNGWQRGLRLK
jgi:hypothetical protein